MLGDQRPTYDPDLERQLLGMLMLLSEANQGDEIKRALGIVRARDFFRTEHRLVFAAILTLNKQGHHFGVEAVHSLLERKGKLNGSLTHFDLEQMQNEGARVAPLVPSEQAVQVRAFGEYRDVLRAMSQMAEFAAMTTDPTRLRARLRELMTNLDREALLATVQTQSFRDLMNTEFPPAIPIVPPLIYGGDCMLIVGHAKGGKSVLVLQLAMAVAAGGMALGTLPVDRPRDVLFLNLDDKPSRVQARARFMLAAYDGEYPEHFEFAHRWPPMDRGGEGMLIQWAEQHPDGVIFIDLLERIRPTRAGNIYEADYAALGPLADIAHTYGVAVVVVHHTNKQGQGPGQEFDPAFAVSGSVAVQGAVDSWLTFHPKSADQPDVRRLTLTGRDVQQTQYQVVFDESVSGWAWEGESVQEKVTKRMPFRRQQVLDAIQEAGRPLRRREIAERTQMNVNQVDNLLYWMKRHDPPQIKDMGDGSYQHPSEYARTKPPGSV